MYYRIYCTNLKRIFVSLSQRYQLKQISAELHTRDQFPRHHADMFFFCLLVPPPNHDRPNGTAVFSILYHESLFDLTLLPFALNQTLCSFTAQL